MSYSHKLVLAGLTLAIASGSSFSAFADSNTTEDSSSPTSIVNAVPPAVPKQKTVRAPKVKTVKAPFDYTKLVAPLEAREDAIAASWVKEFESNGTSLLARKTALTAAYNLTDAKAVKAAVKAAHENFRTTVKQARKDGIAERKLAWDTFNKAVKALKVPVTGNAEGLAESSKDQE